MLIVSICRSAAMPALSKPIVSQFGNMSSSFKQIALSAPVRNFKTNNLLQEADRHFIRRAKEKIGLKDRAMAPGSGTPFQIGQGVVAGASVFGLGALCYYGLGLSKETGQGAIDRSVLWPQYVRERIKTTYQYFGGSIVFTAAAAAAAFRSPAMMNLMMRNSWVVMLGSLAAMIGSGMVVRSMPYTEGFGAKQIGWMVHSGVVGVVLAPLCFLGGPILLRAAYMTAGVVGGLSTIAACAPSEKFLNMGGPLAIGLGVVFASSLATMFVPATTAAGGILYSVSLYGGLVLFSGMLLYDTQKIVHRAESSPHYDPVNESISIFMDTINIFIRLAQMLSMNKRK